MAPPRRSSERSSYRSQRDYLPQQSYPSRRQHPQTSRRQHTPPRRDFPPRRDNNYRRDDPRSAPPRRNPSFQGPRRSGPPPRRSEYPVRRLIDVNPFQRFGNRRPSGRRLPEREYPTSSLRTPRSDQQKWLPPVRNPARYIDPPLDEAPLDAEGKRYPERGITPVPVSRQRSNSFRRSRSPFRRSSVERNGRSDSRHSEDIRPRREGPRTPPEPSASDHSPDNDLADEEHEIFEIVRNILSQCYDFDKRSQIMRFEWLREKLIKIQREIEVLRNQIPLNDELELVDSTDHPNNNVEHDLNGEELDYQEEEPDSSSHNNEEYAIKSPPNDDFVIDHNEGL